ncbi:MAG: hypothetical protein ACK56I_36945, partial [bacterium]
MMHEYDASHACYEEGTERGGGGDRPSVPPTARPPSCIIRIATDAPATIIAATISSPVTVARIVANSITRGMPVVDPLLGIFREV